MNWAPAYPTPHHLKREWVAGATWDSAEKINLYVARSARYDELRKVHESVTNGNVHTAIGGDMVLESSSDDPVFWLVQTYFDYLRSQWQQKSPANATDYNGSSPDGIAHRIASSSNSSKKSRPLSRRLSYSRMTDLRCSSVMVWVATVMMVSLGRRSRVGVVAR
jgi:hypothetical protein